MIRLMIKSHEMVLFIQLKKVQVEMVASKKTKTKTTKNE